MTSAPTLLRWTGVQLGVHRHDAAALAVRCSPPHCFHLWMIAVHRAYGTKSGVPPDSVSVGKPRAEAQGKAVGGGDAMPKLCRELR